MEYTVRQLCGSGHLPITCKDLIDPAPVKQEAAEFSEPENRIDTLLESGVQSTWFIEAVTVTVTDAAGQNVQQATAYATRGKNETFARSKFLSAPPGSVRGSLHMPCGILIF